MISFNTRRHIPGSRGNYALQGFGQVEPNRLYGITVGAIEAQAPAYEKNSENKWVPISFLENGTFMCVIPAPAGFDGIAPMGRIAVLPKDAPATAVPFMVLSERKQYDERESYCDFVDVALEKVDGLLFPKLIGLEPDADIFTTNLIFYTPANAADTGIKCADVFYINDNGILANKVASTNDDPTPDTTFTNTTYQFEVSKVYTMPDGQPGVKFMSKKYVAPATTNTYFD